MFPEFRRRYPRSALISKLLRIDHGKYIVRVRVESEGRILATGLAAADTVESAEDRARERAIAVLITGSEGMESPEETLAFPVMPVSEPPAASKPPVIEPPPAPATVPEIPVIEPAPQPVTVSKTPIIEPEPAPATVPEIPVIEPAPQPVTVSKTPIIEPEPAPAEIAVIEPEPEPVTVSKTPVIEPEPEPEPIIEEKKLEPSPVPATIPKKGGKSSKAVSIAPPEPEPEPEPFSLELEEDNYGLFSDEPEMAIDPEEIPSEPAPVAVPPEEIDYSVLKTKIDVEMKRLGWTTEKGRDYLISTYGKKSRLLLTNEELLEFYNYLSSI
ncbi:hypothetical protein V0288_19090 [Pannus brasiliensis CCIBt3594]|uniref:Uncharacterized protein n=1 Tax=Pannus brasiliensis CCIBt3594 TaxID=1427578 RepID=A0AAW9R0G5_9CHRO